MAKQVGYKYSPKLFDVKPVLGNKPIIQYLSNVKCIVLVHQKTLQKKLVARLKTFELAK
jgi:hypothetical protein